MNDSVAQRAIHSFDAGLIVARILHLALLHRHSDSPETEHIVAATSAPHFFMVSDCQLSVGDLCFRKTGRDRVATYEEGTRHGIQSPTRAGSSLGIGFVSASVFVHDIASEPGTRSVRSVHVQRRYLDGNEAKYTSYFNLAELPQALRVLQLATEYVEACEAFIVDSDQSGGDLC